jgi:hypothetical protein
MKHNYFYFLFLCLIPGVIKAGEGQKAYNNVTDSAIIKKCSDFQVSGHGSSSQWSITDWINLSTQEGAVSQYTTRVKVLYSETGMYFLFTCGDKKISSTMKADNLNLWEEDVVEVFLWPDESYPVYFEYELSPTNFELPIIVPNKKGNFLGWLPWHYDGERRTQHSTSLIRDKDDAVTGWYAEFFIPFKLLTPLIQLPPAAGNKWRANMYRIDYDNGQVPFSWQKTETTFHEYNKFGTIIFR